MAPTFYDQNSVDEQQVPLPSAPRVYLDGGLALQPPLTRRGSGPGLIAFLPHPSAIIPVLKSGKSLDPEPIQKWAEEGFAVLEVSNGNFISKVIDNAIAILANLQEVDTKDKFAIAVYDPPLLPKVVEAVAADPRIACLISYGSYYSDSPVPLLAHLPESQEPISSSKSTAVHRYPCVSPHFVLPHSAYYHSSSAAIAHSRSLVFLRNHVGGPVFDIEAVWEEHTYFEFNLRSVAKTMGTMVEEPYVNHVPTMTGGIGRQKLAAFYRDHFIFVNPADTTLEPVSRTVGSDRVVDEFIFKCTHDKVIDWLLPGVPPSNNKLAIPMLAVINIRGDRLYHEHIWWDQATALLQAGAIPTHLPYPYPSGNRLLRLPVAGADSARLLLDETDGMSNEMFGIGWGVHTQTSSN